jgi:hypothetical protein
VLFERQRRLAEASARGGQPFAKRADGDLVVDGGPQCERIDEAGRVQVGAELPPLAEACR